MHHNTGKVGRTIIIVNFVVVRVTIINAYVMLFMTTWEEEIPNDYEVWLVVTKYRSA